MTSDGALVLVIEDELPLRRLLRTALTGSGFRFLETESGEEGLNLSATHNPDVILLDLGLPDGDGITITRRLREWSHTPIIVISARGREGDKIAALDAGADDYLTKPFGVNELLARIRVALRHSQRTDDNASEINVGALHVDLVRREVMLEGRQVHLTPIEYRLLVLLGLHAGKVLTHKQILREVWGPGYVERTDYLRVYMAALRRKIEENPARPKLLLTEPLVGYRLQDRD